MSRVTRVRIELDATASPALGAVSKLSVAFVGLESAISIAERMIGAYQKTLGLAITASMESRSATDSNRKSLAAFGAAMKAFGTAVGDVVLPVLAGFAEALTPILEGSTKWAKANRAVMATGLLEWSISLTQSLVSGVAKGALYVSRAISGWRQIVSGVQVAVNQLFAGWIEAYEDIIAGAARVASALGQDGLALELQATKNAFRGLRSEFEDSAAAGVREILREEKALASLEAGIVSVEKAVNTVLGKALPAGLAAIDAAITPAAAAAGAKIDKFAEAAARFRQQEADARRAWRQAELQEQIRYNEIVHQEDVRAFEARQAAKGAAIAAAIEAGKAELESFRSLAVSVGETALNALEGALRQLAAGTFELEDALRSAAAALGDLLAQAAKSAILSTISVLAGGGGVGLLGGLFNGGGVVPRRFAGGGTVIGGLPARDSVPALLTPGERVLSTRDVAQLQSGRTPAVMSDLPRGGGDAHINLTVRSVVPLNSAATERDMREALLPVLRKWRAQGAF